jgi:twitching motility protein PilT
VNRIDTFLDLAVKQDGSDLHLVSGNPPRIRIYGDLFPVKYRELPGEETVALIVDTMSEATRRAFESRYSVDYAYEVPGLGRFRVNAFRHLGGLGAVFRAIPHAVKTLDSLGLPSVLKTFCMQKKGARAGDRPHGVRQNDDTGRHDRSHQRGP